MRYTYNFDRFSETYFKVEMFCMKNIHGSDRIP